MYRAIANSELYHCGYKWVVIDENWNTVNKHISMESADKEAARLNAQNAE